MISNFKFQISNFIAKLRALPEERKKVVFFTILAIVGVSMFFLAVIFTKNDISKIKESVKSINFQKINANVPDFPINAPDSQVEIPRTGVENVDSDQSDSLLQNQNYDLGTGSENPEPEN